jgi:hypothetical protein
MRDSSETGKDGFILNLGFRQNVQANGVEELSFIDVEENH